MWINCVERYPDNQEEVHCYFEGDYFKAHCEKIDITSSEDSELAFVYAWIDRHGDSVYVDEWFENK